MGILNEMNTVLSPVSSCLLVHTDPQYIAIISTFLFSLPFFSSSWQTVGTEDSSSPGRLKTILKVRQVENYISIEDSPLLMTFPFDRSDYGS